PRTGWGFFMPYLDVYSFVRIFTRCSTRKEQGAIMQHKAVVLLSGGLDSTTTLAMARQQGFELLALSFEYGQRHQREVEAAAAVARYYGVTRQQTIAIDLRAFGGSALTADIPVPHRRSLSEMATDIPITYVPARNTVFLSFALAYAEVTGANDIFLGINAIDYSGYPDCRPEYLQAYEDMANLATKASTQDGRRFHLHAPLMRLGKADIIRKGVELAVPYHLTWSCYEGGELACGTCDSCLLRLNAFAEVGIADPIGYAADGITL
ncbi:MAG TPA: 7-cyano-7-deazaguanine synthase QueC, partial [Ktedonobacteraceae bacterium]|nr:7-cyano-7-deazaguanine synthase QueC [Ktedonobacteraceae bacterium]